MTEPKGTRAGSATLSVLATDLDGTLIPLDGNQQNKIDLQELAARMHRSQLDFVFVSGRHLSSIEAAIAEFGLPEPNWVIADVGSSIFERTAKDRFTILESYVARLSELLGADDIQALRRTVVNVPQLRLQEEHKQGRFKLSFYVAAGELEFVAREVKTTLQSAGANIQVIASVDPFNGDGLIDVLPRGVSKAYALQWWAEFRNVEPDAIIFAGDSGNDLAAMKAGFKTIIVANASEQVVSAVTEHHHAMGWKRRLHIADDVATSGVLGGVKHFLGE